MHAFAVIEDGRVIAGRDDGLAVPWWSFTKTVLAAAILTCVRDGMLQLDALLPGQRFTLRQLLQHRAGLPDYGSLPEYHEAVARGDEPWPQDLLLEKVAASRLLYEPGAGWQYSNIGYLMLRRILEQTDGDDLSTVLRRRVLKPLGVTAKLSRMPEDLAGVEMGAAAAYHPGWVFHGLLVGPLRDAALLLHRLLNGTLLGAELTLAITAAPRLQVDVGARPWRQPGYGLGVMRGLTARGEEVCGHTGGGPGSVIAVFRRPDPAQARTAATFVLSGGPGEAETQAEQAAFDLINT